MMMMMMWVMRRESGTGGTRRSERAASPWRIERGIFCGAQLMVTEVVLIILSTPSLSLESNLVSPLSGPITRLCLELGDGSEKEKKIIKEKKKGLYIYIWDFIVDQKNKKNEREN